LFLGVALTTLSGDSRALYLLNKLRCD